jgi:ribosomal protein S11
MVGFKWAKENTPYASEVLAKKILKEAKDNGLKEVGIIMRWIGMWRDGVFKAINEIGLIDIKYIKEETPVKFGGVKGYRPKRM